MKQSEDSGQGKAGNESEGGGGWGERGGGGGVGSGEGLTKSLGWARWARVQLHSWCHIHLGASEQLLGARFEAEMAGYAGVWRQQRQSQLDSQIHL